MGIQDTADAARPNNEKPWHAIEIEPLDPRFIPDSVTAKLGREGYVVGYGTATGVANRAVEVVTNPVDVGLKQLGPPIAASAAISALLTRPGVSSILGRRVLPTIAVLSVGSLLMTDELKRSGKAVANTWDSRIGTEQNRQEFSDNFGRVAFDTAAMGFVGVKSAKATDRIMNSRWFVEKKIGPIPQVERPSLQAKAEAPPAVHAEWMTKASAGYQAELANLYKLPRQVDVAPGQSVSQVAEGVLNQRIPITRERIDAKAIADEAARLRTRNNLAEGTETLAPEIKQLVAYSDDDLAQIANRPLQFRFVPQLGQFLKQKGLVTEEHIAEALRIQKSYPPDQKPPLLGQILVENKFVTQTQIDLAFSEQNVLKSLLSDAHKAFLQTAAKSN